MIIPIALIGSPGGDGELFDFPTVQDETDTYTAWGWTNNGTPNPAYTSATSFVSNFPTTDLVPHNHTEGDDLWAYIAAYTRRSSNHAGYLTRAQVWRDWWITYFVAGVQGYDGDMVNGYPEGDHAWGWGLSWYGRQYNDATATAKAQAICNTINTFHSDSTPGLFECGQYGSRGPARHLRLAVQIVNDTGNATAVSLRDKMIDLFLESPDYDPARGLYWYGENDTDNNILYTGAYAAGYRAVSAFHVGAVADAFYYAWKQTGNETLRDRLVTMALWVRNHSLHPTYDYANAFFGTDPDGGDWNYYTSPDDDNGIDPYYTISLVNTLVIGYKLTGEQIYLDRAKHFFNRGTKGVYHDHDARETSDTTVAHYQDTQCGVSGAEVFMQGNDTETDLARNKGEFQYTHLIFQNGGSPTIEAGAGVLAQLAASLDPGEWGQVTGVSGLTNDTLKWTCDGWGLLGYAGQLTWNPIDKQIYGFGAGRDTSFPNSYREWWIRYDEATNTWSRPTRFSWMADDLPHGYDNTAWNPWTGEVYYQQLNSTVRKINGAAGTSTNLAGGGNPGPNGLSGMAFHRTYGSAGSLVVFDSGNIYRLDLSAPAGGWDTLGTWTPSSYHNWAEWSEGLNGVVGGGGNGTYEMRLVSRTGGISTLADCPVDGSGEGFHMAAAPNGDLYMFQTYYDSNYYRYNHLTNSWSSNIGDYPWTGAQTDGAHQFGHCTIYEYGVICIIEYRENSGVNPTMWLYKPL